MVYQTRAFGVCAIASVFMSHSAIAETIEVFAITNNSGSAGTLEGQLSVEMSETAPDSGVVKFVVSNIDGVGSVISVIDALYLDDNGAEDTGGVSDYFASMLLPSDWSAPANPDNLPSASNYDFFATLSADADPPPTHNGISLGESATFNLSLLGGVSFADLVAAFESGEVRVGLHVLLDSSITDEEGNTLSESYIPSVPEPGSLVLMGLGGLSVLRRRR